MAGTNIPTIPGPSWVYFLLNSFPWSWISDAAKNPGGTLYALFSAFGANLALVSGEMVYAYNACRIQTATNTALDLISQDFFGNQLPRLPGETDTAFRARIQAALFVPYVTRQAMILAITNLTGTAPQIISPWNPGDTAAYDWSCYDVNLPGQLPGLYGDPGMYGQVGIISTLPSNASYNSPVEWGYDCGAAYDIYTGIYSPGTASQFPAANSLDALINRVIAAGIVVWRKYLPQSLINYIVPFYFQAGTGASVFNESVQQFVGPYWVIASCTWNASIFVPRLTPTGYVMQSNTPAVGGGFVNALAIPYTEPASGIFYLNVGQLTETVAVPVGRTGARLVVTPSWATNVWITSQTNTQVNLAFSNTAPAGGSFAYYYLPDLQSATYPMPTGATSFVVNTGITGSYNLPFAMPSWNTQYGVSWQSGNIVVTFNTPAPSGGVCNIGYVVPAG